MVGRRRVVQRRVVAQQHHLDILQAHHAIGLGPAAVVADAHAHVAAERPHDREAEIADLEVALLEMLERPLGLVLGMARQMDLAVLAHDAAVALDQDRGVETPDTPFLVGQLRIAQAEAHREALGLREQRRRLVGRHLLLEEGIDLGLVLHPPARKERGERELGKHHELASHALRLAQMGDQPLHHVAAAMAALDGTHLRRPDSQKTRHRHLSATSIATKARRASRRW